MTHAHMDRQVAQVEARVDDIEEGYGETQRELTRRITGLEIWARRSSEQSNRVGQSLTLIMERLGIPPISIPDVTMPTEDDVDAALEADC
ncbi:hypothetical protein [Nocardia amamiensis]|uniref:hypothetical protein n=1 Tax=Nocardia amamiensis TaxID=404578 RepID=UPI000AD48EFA|nr:hypothetical protein [Nocardia amamiensis]